MKEAKIIFIDIDKLVPSEENPQEYSPEKFNRLVRSIEQEGFDENLLVVPIEDGLYRIVSGEHRWRAAKIVGVDRVPCVIKDYDNDKRRFELVKRNAIRGNLNIEKFLRLYDQLSEKYSREVIAEMMALDETELQKIVSAVRKELPEELQKKIDEAKAEIKTVDDLSLLLNRLFSEYGSTLDYNFMIFDWGGKDSLWVRCDRPLWLAVKEIADECADDKMDINEKMKDIILASRKEV